MTRLRAVFLVLFALPFSLFSAPGEAGDAFASLTKQEAFSPLFPDMLNLERFKSAVQDGRAGQVYTAPTQSDAERAGFVDDSSLQSFLLNNDVFALYGKPNAYTMGILGQYPLDKIEAVMDEFVKVYDEANGQRGIIPAFYIIYGTCWPEGEIGILNEAVTRQYIDFAAERGWLVFLDHQIGRYSVESAVNKLLPWLKYDNVHLALDPEWHTDKPMKEIGSVTADDINLAQRMIQDYLVENSLPGRRMLVVHQFKPYMIRNRPAVRSDFERVKLIHCADGIGAPHVKKNTYANNAAATNIPLKSFKLFTKPTVAGAIYDQPIMTPEDVLSLDPRPYLIIYQ